MKRRPGSHPGRREHNASHEERRSRAVSCIKRRENVGFREMLDAMLDLAMLGAQWNRVVADRHLAASSNVDAAAADVASYLRALAEKTEGLLSLAAYVTARTEGICNADHFYPADAREWLLRIEASLRQWADRFEGLVVPEQAPVGTAWRTWLEPYNDAVTTLVRASRASADAIAARVAEEAGEDADAGAWVANGGLDRARSA